MREFDNLSSRASSVDQILKRPQQVPGIDSWLVVSTPRKIYMKVSYDMLRLSFPNILDGKHIGNIFLTTNQIETVFGMLSDEHMNQLQLDVV